MKNKLVEQYEEFYPIYVKENATYNKSLENDIKYLLCPFLGRSMVLVGRRELLIFILYHLCFSTIVFL